jgi:signal peptidase I
VLERDNALSDRKELGATRQSQFSEIFKTVAYAVLIAMVLRAFVIQPFNIPSGSMKSTLLIGDFLFVSKYAYGYSRHSFPFSFPPFAGRFLTGMPERGDVVVFRLPTDTRVDYIKRLIGLPGDRIQVKGGILYINDIAVPREKVEDFVERDEEGNIIHTARYRETLPNGVSYLVLDSERDGPTDNTGVYTVPDGHFFMMGDNRDNSTDSRVMSQVGFVPFDNFVGRAEILFFSTDRSAELWELWRWPQAIRWSRFFNMVR